MPRPADRVLRVTRAAIVAAVVVALAAGAHVTAGGAVPPVPMLLVLSLFAMLPTLVLTGRRLGLPTTLTVLGTGQWVLHHLFTVLTAAPHVSSSGDAVTCAGGVAAAGHGAHHGVAAVCGLGPTAGGTVVHGAATVHAESLGMIALHVVATIVTAAVVVLGDRALWWLHAWLTRLVRLPGVAPVATSRRPLHPPRWDADVVRAPAHRSGCLSRRGPPVPA